MSLLEQLDKDPALAGFAHNDSIFREYLELVIPATEAPLRYHCASALALLGAVLGRRGVLRMGKYRLYTITPAILVGPSGIGKGEAIGLAKAILKQMRGALVEHEGFTVWEPDMWILEDEATPQALVRAFTMKANGDPMGDNDPAEIAIIAGEMATFMGRTGEKEGMIPIITKLLEQDDSYTRTLVQDMKKGENQTVRDPTLSFMAGTTAEWMRKLMPSEMFVGGFFRRCIMVQEDDKGQFLDWPEALGDKAIRKMANLWKKKLFKPSGPFPEKVHDAAGKSLTAAFDITKALEYWKGWKRKHADRKPTDRRLVGHYHSLPQHIMRTAMSFAAARGRLTLLPDDLREAEKFVHSLLDDIHQILLQGEVEGFADQTQLLERIVMDRQEVTVPDIMVMMKTPKKVAEELLSWACDVDMLAPVKKTKDKPAHYVLVNRRMDAWGRPIKSRT